MNRQLLKKNQPVRLVLSSVLDIPDTVEWAQKHLRALGFSSSTMRKTVEEIESLKQAKRELMVIELLSKAMALTKK